VDVADGRDPGAEVEELRDARVAAEPDRPLQERAVGSGHEQAVGQGLGQRVAGGTVGGEVVRATERVVVDPGGAWTVDVDAVRAVAHLRPLTFPPGGRERLSVSAAKR
jgi:hypothetical protein